MQLSTTRLGLIIALGGCLLLGGGLLTACESGGGSPADEPIEEDLNAAYEELINTEGKADGATCSGVRPPDNGPFERRIAITFDDGPSLEKTPQVLEVLDAHDAKATFFINGKQVRTEAHWELLRRMVAEGHTLGNHSQNHVNSREVSEERWRQEVQETHDILEAILTELGETPTYFRFPYGSANCTTYNVVTDFGYHVVGWHIDTADWCFQSSTGGRGYCSPSTFRWVPDDYRDDFPGFSIYQSSISEGGILLMHDIHSYTVENLDWLLTELEEAGYTFTTLEDIDTFPYLNGVTPPRDPWVGDPCTDHSECDFSSDGDQGFCFTFLEAETEELRGFCSLPCDGYCPDMDGAAPTFCVASPDPDVGICVSKAWPTNESCAKIPGTYAREEDRFINQSSAYPSTSLVCVP